jgi:hypothetical protein
MADLLSRLASLAIGEAPAITPRLPSRYEPTDQERFRSQPGPDDAGEEWPRDHELASGEQRHGGRQAAFDDRRHPSAAGRPAAPMDPARQPRIRDVLVPPTQAAAGTPLAGSDPVVPPHRPQQTLTATPRPFSAPAPRPVAIRPAPSIAPPAPVRQESPRGAPPDVVITIGRIEVRATPQPNATTPAPTVPGPDPGPAGLSLADYLADGRHE